MVSEIINRLRQDIPRLNELTEGCYFKDSLGHVHKVSELLSEDRLCNSLGTIFNIKSIAPNDILGHRPTLSDLMEWGWNDGDRRLPVYHILNLWDFSSSYLDTQSKEVVGFISKYMSE